MRVRYRQTDTQTHTQTAVTTIHLASSTTHAKCNTSSAVAEMGGRGHNRHGPKRRAVVPLTQGGELGPCLTQYRLGTISPSGILIHPAVWPQRTWAENWGFNIWDDYLRVHSNFCSCVHCFCSHRAITVD